MPEETVGVVAVEDKLGLDIGVRTAFDGVVSSL